MWLIASDLHLTDSPRDEYRLGIFNWLGEQAKLNNVSNILILGDVTDRKDNHSGKLINFIVESIADIIRQSGDQLEFHFLQGNHDYSDPSHPTLKILNNLLSGDIFWHNEPCVLNLESGVEFVPTLFMPFHRDSGEFATSLGKFSNVDYRVALFHQTFSGSITSTGLRLPGVPPSLVKQSDEIVTFSGDIHVPQRVGSVEYVGSPYQINFGDSFIGRVILFDPKTLKSEDLHYPCLHKHTLEIKSSDEINNLSIEPGDQVKIRLFLTRAEFPDWAVKKREIEDICDRLKVHIYGFEIKDATIKRERIGAQNGDSEYATSNSSDVFDDFCKANKITNHIRDRGRECVDGTS